MSINECFPMQINDFANQNNINYSDDISYVCICVTKTQTNIKPRFLKLTNDIKTIIWYAKSIICYAKSLIWFEKLIEFRNRYIDLQNLYTGIEALQN